jgi:sec-independent protein translocase protein TatA
VPNLGLSELVVILMIVVLVFGASRLPQIGEGMGRAIKNFKKGMASDDAIKLKQIAETERKAPSPGAAQQAEDAEIVDTKR